MKQTFKERQQYMKQTFKMQEKKLPEIQETLFLANRWESKVDKRLDLPENTQVERTQNNLGI